MNCTELNLNKLSNKKLLNNVYKIHVSKNNNKIFNVKLKKE